MNNINSSKGNGTLFEQIALAIVAVAGQPYFVNSGYVATSDEDIDRWVNNDYLYFTRYLGSDGFKRGWSVQGKIHIGDIRIDPDFFDMETGSLFEFKYQESKGSLVEKLYKNILTYQAINDPSFIVHHGKGFDDRFFKSLDSLRQYLKNPDITQFMTFNNFVQEKIGLDIDLTDRNLSIAIDREKSKEVRRKHKKLRTYTERVLFDTKTNSEIARFKTLQLLEDARSDGFKNEQFFKHASFAF